MQGLELCRLFYETYGKSMIENEFGEYADRIAVGLCGHGSECFEFDDGVSSDHDYMPGFCLWLTDEDYEEFGFKLFRAYSKLPKEFMGVRCVQTNSLGESYRGVHTVNEFFSFYLGNGFPETNADWLSIPDFYLAEATNGEVFRDDLGVFSQIRYNIKAFYPNDVRLKKLASALFNMAQYGQYNYGRCILHGETAAACVALSEFAKNACHAVYLLNKEFMPYYKWMFKGMERLEVLSELKEDLTRILSNPLNGVKPIEEISSKIIAEVKSQGLSNVSGTYSEPHAYSVQNKITDTELRNSDIMI